MNLNLEPCGCNHYEEECCEKCLIQPEKLGFNQCAQEVNDKIDNLLK